MKRLAITLGLVVSCLVAQLSAVPGQVTIIPSAENDAAGNLTQKGLERAGALAPYFALTPFLIPFGAPYSIFAARPTPNLPPYGADENTDRCLQTVVPTGLFLRLPIHPGYAKLQETQIADFILNNSLYDGKNILICWHQDAMQALATAFGVVGAPVYPAGVSNITWIITFSPGPVLLQASQLLLVGD